MNKSKKSNQFNWHCNEYKVTPESSTLRNFYSKQQVEKFLNGKINQNGYCQLWVNPRNPLQTIFHLRFGCLNFPHIPVVILTAFGTIETAVNAMKNGAFDFLAKPVDHGQLIEVVTQAICSSSEERQSFDPLLGLSSDMEKFRRNITLFASTDSSVLIRGDSGTGKGIAARSIHAASQRKAGPFVKVNCAAIPRDLLESELFGHIKGAFTGALTDRKGAFILADKGVLFLDEIGDLPLELQAKLLHAVEEKNITPVGSTRQIPVSVKILSATNQDLETMIEKRQFRADLYYRLNTVTLNMPGLRDKPSDIKELAVFFREKFCREFERPDLALTDDALKCLQSYAWPGNVRELKNVMERAVLTCTGSVISCDDLPGHMSAPKASEKTIRSEPVDFNMASQEQNLMLAALEQCGWNQVKTAKKTGHYQRYPAIPASKIWNQAVTDLPETACFKGRPESEFKTQNCSLAPDQMADIRHWL